MSRLNIRGHGISDMTEGAVIYGASETEEGGRFRGQTRSRGTGVSLNSVMGGNERGGVIQGGIVYRSPTLKSADRIGKRRAEAVARFTHDGWGLQYTERKRTLEVLFDIRESAVSPFQ